VYKEENQELEVLIANCQKGKRAPQEELYLRFYNYAMSICLRYSRDREEALEIVNDGFIKVLRNLDKYTLGLSFKGWLRRIMINTAIDYYRRNEKFYHSVDISYARHQQVTEDALGKISEKEIIALIQLLPPSYRMVFNLFAIEGFKHHEIAQKLKISVGTSKSNLAVARSKLKKMLLNVEQENYIEHG